jgi:hypothetical protein
MPSWSPLGFAAVLGAAGAAWAAEQPATKAHVDLIVPSVADLYLGVDAAPEAAAPADSFPERTLDASFDGTRPRRDERMMLPLEMRLGRTPAVGRSPGDAPPLYGEIGIDLDARADLSLVPSYRVVLPGDREDAQEQILKLGARVRF